MARLIKQGLNYFPLNVDFLEDIKVRKIKKSFGANSISVLVCLLCNIYRETGYYIGWSDDNAFLISETIGVNEGAVNEIVNKAVQIGFFDEELYKKYKILTSRGIQNRYLMVVNSSKLKRDEIDARFKLFESSEEIAESSEESEKNSEESTQRKEKKRKEDEEEVNNIDTITTTWEAECRMYTLVSNLNRWESWRKNHFGSDKKRADEYNELIIRSLSESEIENLTEYEYSQLISKLFLAEKSNNPVNYFRRCYDELHCQVLEVI